MDKTLRRKEKIFETDKKQRTDERKCQVVLITVRCLIGEFWYISIDLYRVNIPSAKCQITWLPTPTINLQGISLVSHQQTSHLLLLLLKCIPVKASCEAHLYDRYKRKCKQRYICYNVYLFLQILFSFHLFLIENCCILKWFTKYCLQTKMSPFDVFKMCSWIQVWKTWLCLQFFSFVHWEKETKQMIDWIMCGTW